jgi:2-dehydro-3-deoxygluconokinase
MTGHGLVTIGESLGLFRPASTDPHSPDFRLTFGGAESNVAIGVSRLGERSTWVGRLGDDPLARRIRRELRAEGVVDRAIIDPDAATALMMKTAAAPGRTRVQYWRADSAGSRLDIADIDPEVVRGAQILHVTGITAAISPRARAAVLHAVDIARDAGVTVSFDVNHRPTLWRDEDPRPVYRALAERSDILFAGDEEGELLVAAGDVRAQLDAIAALGPATVAIKRGAQGCIARHDDEVFTRAALPVAVVDTVGAGDAFVAGFLAETLRGEGFAARLDTAVIAGAFACTGPGDWESLPDRRQLALLRDVDGDPVLR